MADTTDALRVVHGRLTLHGGTPVPRARIRVLDVELAGDTLLGDTPTDASGTYTLRYSPTRLGRPGKTAADLKLLVLPPDGDDQVLAQSDVRYGAAPDETVDLEIEVAAWLPSAYERLVDTLAPALAGRPAYTLRDDEIRYLAATLKLDPEPIRNLRESSDWAHRTGLPAEVFHALQHARLPADPLRVAAEDRDLVADAIRSAAHAHVIPPHFEDDADALADTDLPDRAADQLLAEAPDTAPASLGDLLRKASVPEAGRRTFAKLVAKRPLEGESFWKSVARQLDLTEARLAELRTLLDLSALSGGFLPMVDRLLREPLRAGVRDLARLQPRDWEEFVTGTGVPRDVLPGGDPQRRIAFYAAQLHRGLEERHPTAVLAARIGQGHVPVAERIRPHLERFFAQNPVFEFDEHHITGFLAPDGGADLRGIPSAVRPRLREDLLRLDRVTRIVPRQLKPGQPPRYGVMAALLSAGFDSAYKITRVGRADFTAAMTDALAGDRELAEQVHARAEDVTALASTLVTGYATTAATLGTAVLPATSTEDRAGDPAAPPPKPGLQVPDMRTLLGNLDFCACEHCRSAYSPAAYLVDALKFLADRPLPAGTGPRTALEALTAPGRRPDLAETKLSCENTNTRLEQADLAMEILENAVSPRPAGPYPQTTWTEEELLANPEHLHDPAYDELRRAVYPWALPFDLRLAEVRTYLGELGVSRRELMQSLGEPAHDEALGLDPRTTQLITEATPAAPWALWGLDETVNDLRDARDGSTVSGPWVTVLSGRISLLLQQSGLELVELRDLLDTRFVNPDGHRPTIEGAACDLTKRTATWLTAPHLTRMARFVRLAHILGWHVHDLDRAATAYGANALTPDFLRWLAHAHHLASTLKLRPADVAAWWSRIDTHRYVDHGEESETPASSPYDLLFLNLTVVSPAPEALALNAARSELARPYRAPDGTVANADATITAHRAAVVLALGIGTGDLSRLLDAGVPDELGLANLSTLHRMTSLARALGLSVRDWLRVTALTGLDPFPGPPLAPPDRAAATVRFVMDVEHIRASGFTPTELDHVLRHQPAPDVAASAPQLAAAVGEIRDGLRTIAARTTAATDPQGEALAGFLSQLGWDAELISGALGAGALGADARTDVPLAELPPGVVFPGQLPAGLKEKVSFDQGTLITLGALRKSEQDLLLDLPADKSTAQYARYATAVQLLHTTSQARAAAPVDFLVRRMQSLTLPVFRAELRFEADLEQLPAGVVLPDDLPARLADRVTFQAKKLRCSGLMSAGDHDALRSLSDTAAWHKAVDELYVDLRIPATLAPGFGYDAEARSLYFTGWMTDTVRGRLLALSTAPACTTAVQVLFTASNSYVELDPDNAYLGSAAFGAADAPLRLFEDARSAADRFRMALDLLLPTLRRRQSAEWVAAALARSLAVPGPVARALADRLTWPGRTAQTVLDAFLDPLFVATTGAVSMAACPDQYSAFIRLRKAALVLTRLRCDTDDVAGLLREDDWTFLAALPIQPSKSPVGYAAWRKLTALCALRDRLPGQGATLRAVFAASRTPQTTLAAVLARLAELTAWNAADLAQAATGLGMTVPADVRDEALLTQLTDCVGLFLRLGSSAAQCRRWAQHPILAADADAARQAARAGLGANAWLERARPLRDELRERQRVALVDHLVHHERLRDADDLYGRFLIDVQMSPCARTTRIRQAMSAVQLFVQRCHMNLEPEVPPSAIPVEQWTWMKSYRVWEANRKVLFHPARFAEPELRRDKSPAFVRLESELQQGEIDADKAERAFRGYLEELDQVARLETVATCVQRAGGREIRHVFGRTFNTPTRYFYRRRVESLWYPWQPVDLDIEGDHLLPVVWDERLMLFWLKFQEKAEEPVSLPQSATGSRPKKFWTVQLVWSECRDGKWSTAQLLDPPLKSAGIQFAQPKEFFLAPLPDKDSLTIAVGSRGTPESNPSSYDGSDPVYEWKVLRAPRGKGRLVLGNDRVRNKASHPFGAITPYTDLSFNAVAERNVTIQLPVYVLTAGGTGRQATAANKLFDRRTQEAANPFRLTFPVQAEMMEPAGQGLTVTFLDRDSFFYSDRRRSYLAAPVTYSLLVNYPRGAVLGPLLDRRGAVRFESHFHPYVAQFTTALNTGGIPGLLSLDTQRLSDSGVITGPFGPAGPVAAGAAFVTEYAPRWDNVYPFDWPRETVDFSADGAYSSYNWELFFHAPLLIATRLGKNRRFAQAQQWFHKIFDPTVSSTEPSPARYWRLLPFHTAALAPPIQELARLLADKSHPSRERQEMLAQVRTWRENPFDPHAVARLRPSAYQQNVLMKYLTNLVEWGDQLFRQDTIESINQAAQLYVLADQLLGPRPEELPAQTRPAPLTYRELEPSLDELANALVAVEGLLPPSTTGPGSVNGQAKTPPVPVPLTLYFCVPHDDALLRQWDIVADRLFKIRHCMNLAGTVRELDLFGTPLDPGALVRALAGGADLDQVLADGAAGPPSHRFAALARKATELCTDVRQLGSLLLAALEKRDAERLAVLRSGHELALLDATRSVRNLQIQEAQAQVDALLKSMTLAHTRCLFYVEQLKALETITIPAPTGQTRSQILGAMREVVDGLQPRTPLTRFTDQLTSLFRSEMDAIHTKLEEAISQKDQDEAPGASESFTLPMNSFERRQLAELKTSNEKQLRAMDHEAAAQLFALIPDFTLGLQGWAASPVIQAQIGGTLLSTAARLHASGLNYEANEHSYRASLHQLLGGYRRRADEWLHQADLARQEGEQIGAQLSAAGLRLAITRLELLNHDTQTAGAREADAALRDKYTDEDLYAWQVEQISAVHHAAYELAFDLARRAERAYRFELGIQDSDFIRPGHWDGLKQGLLAGERLAQDLQRMEVSYLDQHRRAYELTRHVSLSQLDAAALIRLKVTGACEVELPEGYLDLDCPGHYARRINSVALSVLGVAGRHTSVNCTLTLLRSTVRVDPDPRGGYPRTGPGDTRFVDDLAAAQSIVTSRGTEDPGLFESQGGTDERYLPFEGYGAISRWRLELPSEFRQFDYATITDAVIHLRYTARDGGRRLADAVRSAQRTDLGKLMASADGRGGFTRALSLRHEFADWYRLTAATGDREITLEIADRFPFLLRDGTLTIDEVGVFIKATDRLTDQQVARLRKATFDGKPLSDLTGWLRRKDVVQAVVPVPGPGWNPAVSRKFALAEVPQDTIPLIDDIWLLCHYTVKFDKA
ncbi:Tc toxin subunit A-related protein [Streptomyces endophyticus]|uniref:Neuraminidase-like domain-containing protein n=1 Tax=Streptomyces endophyticus TaxID=714166 RepID=A0ABU6F4Q9_9ACTN|nr:neuraminidase-like domain-containing protein [Streptomyces endophyticus]MEB8338473.1 neuraminidase-like domain-containing protein [Streptomyces endophyticus]